MNALNKQEFLLGGGEAGEIIRMMDWSVTPAGTWGTWPQHLRTTISIILQSHVPMFIAWGPCGTLFFNDACQPLIALPAMQSMGRPAPTVFADRWIKLQIAFDQVMQGNAITLPEVTLSINRHGYTETASFTFSCIPLVYETGEAGGMLVTASETIETERTHEISHKNKALEETTRELKEINQQLELRNEELRQSEERYLRMTNEVEDYAIILLSKEGLIENWNKGAEKIKGYMAEEIVGKHFRLFYTHTEQLNGLAERLIEEASRKGSSTFEGWRVRKDGSTFWGYTVITALHDDKNDIIGFSKVTRDLTERKMAEDRLKMYAEQLEQKNRELERSNSELSSFSYVASHDLQEPLRKIQAFGNLIQARDVANLSETSKDYFDRMVKAAVRMQNLIDSLLEFSRTTTTRKSFEPTDLNVLLDEVKKELAHRIEEKKAVIESSHLPTLTIIPFQFRQLLSNLINNSLKYSKGDVTPVIDIRATYVKARDLHEKAALPGKDYFRFSVVDNGIGFEQEYSEKIFELFQRLHGRNEYSGSGIGLAICKKIVENHNGFMRAEGEMGKGATFYFFVPVK